MFQVVLSISRYPRYFYVDGPCFQTIFLFPMTMVIYRFSFIHLVLFINRSSHQRCSIIKGALRNFANSQEITCTRVSFLIRLQEFFTEYLWATASVLKLLFQTLLSTLISKMFQFIQFYLQYFYFNQVFQQCFSLNGNLSEIYIQFIYITGPVSTQLLSSS